MPSLPCFWCLSGAETAIYITVFTPNVFPSNELPLVLKVLSDALTIVRQVTATGDGVIPTGSFSFSKYSIDCQASNANNHQLTWGVMGAAIEALANFMTLYGFGAARFGIYDGDNLVGQGVFQPT